MHSHSQSQPDLLHQYHSIISPNSTATTEPQPITFIKALLSFSNYPSCRQCHVCLMNQNCFYQDSYLLCQMCRQYNVSQGTSPKQFCRIDLSEMLEEGWSLGDHLELLVLLEMDMRQNEGKSGFLQLGKRMFNKKDSLQILQYIRNRICQSKPSPSCLNISQYVFFNQKLTINFSTLKHQNNKEEAIDIFQRYQSKEDSTIRKLIYCFNQRNSSKELFKMALFEAQTAIKIYQSIIKASQEPLYQTRIIQGFKSQQINEELTNTNEYMKNSHLESGQSLQKDKWCVQEQLLSELSGLVKKSKAFKKKRIGKDKRNYIWQ